MASPIPSSLTAGLLGKRAEAFIASALLPNPRLVGERLVNRRSCSPRR